MRHYSVAGNVDTVTMPTFYRLSIVSDWLGDAAADCTTEVAFGV